MKTPKLTLVGAGPGDPELITLKGIRALEAADVVLYDALANDDLLAFAKNAKIIEYVGKRQGDHSLPQEIINETIVRYALSHGHVVRLKGGDPFVFGRGFEELEFAAQHGIEGTVVPGVSSATSLLGLLNIPITHRGISRSFHVFSANTKDGELSDEILDSVHLQGTRVVLMGLQHLGKIAALYRQHGLAELPVVVIQNGSLPEQRTAFGTMEKIEATVAENGIKTPAIIVIGEVVGLATAALTSPQAPLLRGEGSRTGAILPNLENLKKGQSLPPLSCEERGLGGEAKNTLFPIFLKAHQLKFLIVGAGYVCEEKLNFLLKSSPLAHVTIVAPMVRPEVLAVIAKHEAPNVRLVEREFQPEDVKGHQIVIAATCIDAVNAAVKASANSENVLVNVADDPPRCDFYMGGIVSKGNVKIAISTNGKSPTLTKRLRQFFEEMLPDELDELSETLNAYRQTLKGDFETKVNKLNDLTKELIS